MTQRKSAEQILTEYEKELNEIYDEMVRIFLRAQRKVEDAKYREALDKLGEYKQNE